MEILMVGGHTFWAEVYPKLVELVKNDAPPEWKDKAETLEFPDLVAPGSFVPTPDPRDRYHFRMLDISHRPRPYHTPIRKTIKTARSQP